MAERIPQSITIRVPLQAYLLSDHVSPATGKTIAITVSKNGAAYGNPSAGATNAIEIGSGSYYVDLSTTDTGTLGPLFVKGTEAATDTIIGIYDVVSATTGGLSNLDAAISSRMATYTQPTGFLAATFPSGTVANTTNITAGTITTVTNLTNAPTSGDLTAAMKASVTTAATAATPTAAAVTGSVGSVIATISANVVSVAAAASNVKKNTALNAFEFIMTDSTNHTPTTGYTVTAQRSIDGAAFASCTNAVSEISNGWYSINLSATDLNGNTIGLRFSATAADDQDILIITQP